MRLWHVCSDFVGFGGFYSLVHYFQEEATASATADSMTSPLKAMKLDATPGRGTPGRQKTSTLADFRRQVQKKQEEKKNDPVLLVRKRRYICSQSISPVPELLITILLSSFQAKSRLLTEMVTMFKTRLVSWETFPVSYCYCCCLENVVSSLWYPVFGVSQQFFAAAEN